MKGQTGCADDSSDIRATRRPASRWMALWKHVGRWYELARQRRQLARMSDAGLEDLGLSRADIHQESERPFWDDPFCK